jgi:hypothetical protein
MFLNTGGVSMVPDNFLAFKMALEGYTRTLVQLVLVVADKKKQEIAHVCGVAPSLVGQWIRGTCPLAPPHERVLRSLFVKASQKKRAMVEAMGNKEQRRLQHALLTALTALDSAYITLSIEYDKSRKFTQAQEAGRLHAMAEEAMTPAVGQGVQAALQEVQTTPRIHPDHWKFLSTRNRALRRLVNPQATADVCPNVKELLTYAESWYGLEKNEDLEQRSGVERRQRGRPRKARHTTV